MAKRNEATPPLEGISLIIPACDQATALEKAVPAWVNILEGLRRPYEVLIVNDASASATTEQAAKLATRFPNVRQITHNVRQGFGACIRTGIGEGKQELLLLTALEYPYLPADLREMLARIDQHDAQTNLRPDFVNGFRAKDRAPLWARLVGGIWRGFLRFGLGIPTLAAPGWLGLRAYGYSWFAALVFGVHFGDPQSACKLFRRSILKRIVLQSSSAFVLTELAAKANFLGVLMDEVAVNKKAGPYVAQPYPVLDPKQFRRDLSLVFRKPDFGPVTLADEEAKPSAPTTAAAT